MGTNYLIDTNILIYFSSGKLPLKTVDYDFYSILKESFNISVITQIEFLGWKKHTPITLKRAKTFLSFANIFPLDQIIIDKTIQLRQNFNLKLPDAIIASTALVNNLVLLTRNVKDFTEVKALKIYNPFSPDNLIEK